MIFQLQAKPHGPTCVCCQRYPRMHDDYVARCARGDIDLGHVRVFREADRLIVGFPTKHHWRDHSSLRIIEAGLRSLRRLIETEAIPSIAIPALGCGRGRLRWPAVRLLALHTLTGLPTVRIELHAPRLPDWARLVD